MKHRRTAGRAERIEALIVQGLNGEQIAAQIGIKYSALKAWCFAHRVSLRRARRGTMITVDLSAAELERWREEAVSRGRTSPHQLVADVVSIVTKDNLFNAVLDLDH